MCITCGLANLFDSSKLRVSRGIIIVITFLFGVEIVFFPLDLDCVYRLHTSLTEKV